MRAGEPPRAAPSPPPTTPPPAYTPAQTGGHEPEGWSSSREGGQQQQQSRRRKGAGVCCDARTGSRHARHAPEKTSSFAPHASRVSLRRIGLHLWPSLLVFPIPLDHQTPDPARSIDCRNRRVIDVGWSGAALGPSCHGCGDLQVPPKTKHRWPSSMCGSAGASASPGTVTGEAAPDAARHSSHHRYGCGGMRNQR